MLHKNFALSGLVLTLKQLKPSNGGTHDPHTHKLSRLTMEEQDDFVPFSSQNIKGAVEKGSRVKRIRDETGTENGSSKKGKPTTKHIKSRFDQSQSKRVAEAVTRQERKELAKKRKLQKTHGDTIEQAKKVAQSYYSFPVIQ